MITTHFKGSSNFTVAAEWKTIDTLSISNFTSDSLIPSPSLVKSPWMAINLDIAPGCSFFTLSNSCRKVQI